MRNILLSLVCAAAFVATGAHAADKPKTAQQQKMATCNKEVGDRKGDERKAFMSACLSSKPADASKTAQQDRKKACNKEAAGKKGDEHKALVNECMSRSA